MSKEYGQAAATHAYVSDSCPECGGKLMGSGSLENDDGLHFWTVKNCDGCKREFTIVLDLVPNDVVGTTGD